MKNKTIFIITGEASGDIYGAQLVKEINRDSNSITFFGVGSFAMKATGVNIIIDSKKLSVMGITEVLPKIPFIIHSIRQIKDAMKKNIPNLVILIDSPDFNFIIASEAKKLNIPVLYYISPQIWAWRKGRIKKIKKLVDHMAVILPFEEIFYKKNNIPVTFVGHPLLDNIHPMTNSLDQNGTDKLITVGLLPGSRNGEISKLLPIMIKSAQLIKKTITSAKFIISCANSIESKMFNKIIKKHTGSLNIIISYQPPQEIFNKCHCLIAASGTVTLEAGLFGIPTVIIYKLSPLSYLIGKTLINVRYIGLVNLILKQRLFPELIQKEASANNVAKTIISLLEDPKKLLSIKQQLLHVKACLGGPGASKRVAAIAMNMIH